MIDLSGLGPFMVFAAVMTGTPGPNNAMVTVSSARVGTWRTLPMVMGITIGVSVMFVAMAYGLHALLAQAPWLSNILRGLATLTLLWIAWKILHAGPLSDTDQKPLLGFLGAAGFQWVNPKAWAITGSAAAIYLPVPATLSDILLRALLMMLVGTCLVTLWALLGSALRRPLQRPGFARVFNTGMALLLIAATLPVLISH